ncbi:MAG: UvrD-helicase domain-containing protein [SAR324 cluster bacterium]|nr:UvrD-helicase domain-containing protein [SAR324 cluster bacterium]
MTPDLDSLNPQQREAVTATDGPILVLAGAGSGKTRVVTTRIAHLILSKSVPPERILALTFTNKAAREMAERVSKMLPVKLRGNGGAGEGKRGPRIGTFHSFGVRFLRVFIHHAGYAPAFVIYDNGDQLAVVREILEQMEDQIYYNAKSAHYELQRAKSRGITPGDLLARSDSPADVLLGAIYEEYQRTLKAMNAVDFEDILRLTLCISLEHADEAAQYFSRYLYVQVDEYQDTNRVQYDLLREIVRPHGNVCVVGDDDQSIYGWRGAEPGNILNFENDFPGAHVIRLEQNYRSTETILAAANQVIAKIPRRMAKTLKATKDKGHLLEWLLGEDERDEVEKVVTHIRLSRMREGSPLSDYAILYRSNHQSRRIEEELREEGIPYFVVGSTRFYDRKEVKDAAAYLRLSQNPKDEVSLFRIINFPRRGIGKTSRLKLAQMARLQSRPCIELMREGEFIPELGEAAGRSMSRLADLIDRYHGRFSRESLGPVFRDLLAELKFHRAVEQEKTDPKAMEAAVGLVLELEQSADHFARTHPGAGLKEYLDRIALLSMPEENLGGERTDMVRLMTVHSAKGLEFPRIYLIGMADEVFPNHHALRDGAEDEERRLAYVAITRAKQRLVFSAAKIRQRWGQSTPQQPSRFLLDIDPRLFDGVPPQADAGHGRRKYLSAKAEKNATARKQFFEQMREIGAEQAEQ